MFVGRAQEIQDLQEYYGSGRPEFIAMYGRRRVGKTHLIREFFGYQFDFQVTGMENVNREAQLKNFAAALRRNGGLDNAVPCDWFSAFELLIDLLESKESGQRQVVFFDEMPWFDTPSSGFIPALEHFWNSWGSAQPKLMLIACGSAASWVVNKLISGHGGLYDRVTRVIPVEPFLLCDCEELLEANGISLSRYEIVQSYMVFGGVPYYLEQIKRGISLSQNVDRLCFAKTALLRDEFSRIYASLFKSPEPAIATVKTLAAHNQGLTREELIKKAALSDGGSTATMLAGLEQSGFIKRFYGFGKKERSGIYQICDPFSLFSLNFMGDSGNDPEFWSKYRGSGGYNSWSGHAFEQVCLAHVEQIKRALSIGGVLAHTSSWRSRSTPRRAQIDLVIDRADQIINLCEMKFSEHSFTLNASEDEKLRKSMALFVQETRTRKAIHPVLVTTYGLGQGKYAGLFQNTVTMDDLFAKAVLRERRIPFEIASSDDPFYS